jgi:hypothetical protein
MTVNPILTDAVSMWDRLEASGLAPASYDKDFAEHFACKLKLQPGRSIRDELHRLNPSVNDVLAAFVGACQAFDSMAQDVWKMFVEADARFADQNLQIAFDFGAKQPDAIKFDLSHFKAFHEGYGRLKRAVATYPLTRDFLWGLERHLRSPSRDAASREAAAWVADYDRRRWPSAPPPIPPTGDARSDACLKEARDILVAVVSLLVANGARPGEGPTAFRERMHMSSRIDERDLDPVLREALGADHDLWVRSFVLSLDQTAARLASGGTDRRDQSSG